MIWWLAIKGFAAASLSVAVLVIAVLLLCAEADDIRARERLHRDSGGEG